MCFGLLCVLLGQLENVVEGEGEEEVALPLVELGLELNPMQSKHKVFFEREVKTDVRRERSGTPKKPL